MPDADERVQVLQNKARIREFYDQVYNGRNLAALATSVSEDYVEHNPEMGSGRAALEEFLKHVFDIFPEIEFKIEHIVAEHDLVVAHTIMKKSASDPGSVIAEFFRLSNGVIVERWDVVMSMPKRTKSENR